MKKHITEMPMEEQKKLLPITLEKHNLEYKQWYEIEKQCIMNAMKVEDIARINHIGSSAVKDLIAKPIVDILLEITTTCDVVQLKDNLNTIGWDVLRHESEPMKIMFIKGYTFNGFLKRVYHLHVGYLGNGEALYFRDYLIAHPDVAAKYGELKLDILKSFKNNISIFEHGYGDAKTDFILKYTDIAKQEFPNRYKPIQNE